MNAAADSLQRQGISSPAQALRHVTERSRDFSQARQELGHATNAAALVGRRTVVQGVFLDRRAFLVSYDPTQDLPRRHGIGRDSAGGRTSGSGHQSGYYFSTVNNERLGRRKKPRITSPGCLR